MSDKLHKLNNLIETKIKRLAFNQVATDWWNNKLLPALKSHAQGVYDPMMTSDQGDKVKVFTKMYKSGGTSELKNALSAAGCTNVTANGNEASYRGSATGTKPPEAKG